MTNAHIWKVIASAGLALICIIIVQTYWLKNSFDLSVKAFEEKVQIGLRNTAELISVHNQVQLPAQGLINQISQDYYVVNIRDAIDASSLEYYLRKEFEAVALHTDFEYGIYDCNTDQMVYGNYIQSSRASSSQIKDASLPTYDEFIYYFGVRFPDRRGYILKNQWLPISFTAILCLAILFFIYATAQILKQKKLSDLQKDFINNMTHEFKTPLSSIKVSAEVFLEDKHIQGKPRLKTYAKIIQDQTSRLNEQVERVLQIAGIGRKNFQIKKDDVLLKSLVEHVATQFESRIEKQNGKLTLDLDDLDYQIYADSLHLSNILFNLLDNSIKYSDAPPEIIIQTRKKGKNILLRVIDNGIGIAKSHLQKIGQKFYRVPTGNIYKVKGFGLGLYYVFSICNLHKWKPMINSEIGKGTTITIQIPT